MDEIGIHTTVFIDRVKLPPYNAQGNDRIDCNSNTQSASNCKMEGETDGKDTCIVGEIPVQHIGRPDETGRMMKYIVRWYGNGPDADTRAPEAFTTTFHHQILEQTKQLESMKTAK